MRFGISSILRFSSASALSLSLILGLVGCADMMTYSQDSQRQGETLYKQGDYANAAGAFRNSVRQNPRNYQGHYYMASCYEKMGQYQQAIVEYRTARQTQNITLEGKYDDETRSKIFDGLAGAIAKSDQRNVEIDQVAKDAESHQSAEDWYLLAKVFELRGDPDSAIDAYNHAALLDTKSFPINKDYGLFLIKAGQTQRAETPLRKAYAIKPEDQQVVSALRQIGIVPGPSLKDESQLAHPLMPKGPIPEVKVQNLLPGSGGSSNGQSTVAAPRD